MKFDLAHYVQRGHNFAIVDEVDSILIDEARTPLIISGPAEESTDLYYEVDRIIPRLTRRGHARRRQGRGARGTREDRRLHRRREAQDGHADRDRHGQGREDARASPRRARRPLRPGRTCRCSTTSIRPCARTRSSTIDVDYMVKDGGVVIVDEFTGRLMPGRRWSDGLHQAVEAKEHNTNHPEVKIERENQTLATVTFQNYFRKYKKLSGMTGTADTEAEEFAKIYNLDVMVIPTNRVLRRIEEPDTRLPDGKGEVRRHRQRHPREAEARAGRSLVGTVSIEKSERLSKLLKLRGIKHVVLNAKYHAQEAEIVAQAGRKATVTIATNMAGRGTDILLGGNAEFMARQQTLADEIAERLPKGEEKFVDDDEFVYFYHLDSFYRVPRDDYERIYSALQDADRCRARRGRRRSAVCTSSAPSGTRRAASTTSCAAAPAARATPARPASTCRSKTT